MWTVRTSEGNVSLLDFAERTKTIEMPQSRRNQKPASSSHSKEAVESMSGGPTSSTRSDRWPDEHPLDPANSAAFNERKAAFDHFSPKAKRLKRGEEHHQQHQEQKEGQAKARKMSKPDGQVEGETLEGDANDGPDKGRPWTLAIAIPGSMLDNATSHEMKTYITGVCVLTKPFSNADQRLSTFFPP